MSEFVLKKIKEDQCDLLYEWVNEKDVRKNSFNTEKIGFEEHKRWFEKRIRSSDTIIFICYLNNVPVGQIRLDKKGSIATIDFSVAKEYRNKGIGKKMLRKLQEEIKNHNFQVRKLIGQVKYTNIASQKIFKELGFDYTNKDEYIEYSLYLN